MKICYYIFLFFWVLGGVLCVLQTVNQNYLNLPKNSGAIVLLIDLVYILAISYFESKSQNKKLKSLKNKLKEMEEN